ncbi:MAG: DMT family transporter [Deltaproteobacteria bacterium]|jgi:drug/metabolite transporter (DMT)-like permease|nr:DMT family transporter [Deltaproteobacteria bacterium]
MCDHTAPDTLRQKIFRFTGSRPRLSGYLGAVLATFIWSGNFIAGRVLKETATPSILTFWRCMLAALILLPFALPGLKREWPVVRANIKFFILLSILGISIPNIFIYSAARYSQTLNLSILALSVPLFVIILARIFLGEHLSLPRVFGLAVTIIGILLLLSKGDINLLMNLRFERGDLLIFGNTIPFAVYTLMLRKMPKGIRGTTFMLVFLFLGAVFVIPPLLWELCTDGYMLFSFELAGWLLYVSLGASILGYAFWNLGVAKIGSARTSIIYYLIPVFCGIEGILLLNEPVLSVHVISMALIIAGTFLAINAKK